MNLFKKPHPTKLRVTIQFIVERDGDGFHAYSPILKGLHVDGVSEGEATADFCDAARAYLESVLNHGEPLPLGVIVEAPEPLGPMVTRHSEEIDLTCVPPPLLASGISSEI